MKKAFAWLEGNRIEYQLHDYKKGGISAEKLKAWAKQVGWEALLNTKGTTFRKLPESRQANLDAAKALGLMQEMPSAIKRPVVEGGSELLVGFDPERYRKALSK